MISATPTSELRLTPAERSFLLHFLQENALLIRGPALQSLANWGLPIPNPHALLAATERWVREAAILKGPPSTWDLAVFPVELPWTNLAQLQAREAAFAELASVPSHS